MATRRPKLGQRSIIHPDRRWSVCSARTAISIWRRRASSVSVWKKPLPTSRLVICPAMYQHLQRRPQCRHRHLNLSLRQSLRRPVRRHLPLHPRFRQRLPPRHRPHRNRHLRCSLRWLPRTRRHPAKHLQYPFWDRNTAHPGPSHRQDPPPLRRVRRHRHRRRPLPLRPRRLPRSVANPI